MTSAKRAVRSRKDEGPPRSASGKPSGGSSSVPIAPLPIEELVRLPTLMFPRLSWQRDRIAFYWDRTGRNELYVQTIGKDDPRQVSHGEVSRSVRYAPIWSRSGRFLTFTKDKDGDEKFDVFRLDLGSGEVTRLTELGADMAAVEFSPDDRWVLLVTNAPGRGGRSQLNLWRAPSSGDGAEQLTEFRSPAGLRGNITYSPDGRSIAFSTNESPDLRNSDVYVCAADGSDPRRVFRGREGSQDGPAAWHPDGRRLAIQSDVSGSERPGALDLTTGEVRWFGADGIDETTIEFSPDGRRLLTVRENGVRSEPRLYDVASGQESRLPGHEGVVLTAEFYRDGRSVVVWDTTPVQREQFTLLRAGRPPKVLRGAEYGALAPDRFVNCRVVRYGSADGREIEALLYAPPSPPSGRRFPAVVEVHGGPTARFRAVFNELAQCLVSRGLVVLQPNVRGSTGYGVGFRDLNRYDWGGGDLQDIVAGVRYLVGEPYIDPKRIGIWGGSYGGFLTYLASVKQPELWKAACAWVGISDLERLYDESREHYQYYFREQMGDPETSRTLWRDRSAIHLADRLRARLLMVHGLNDPRCPVDQARAFRERLIELGRKEGPDFEYVELSEEGHGSTDIEQRLRSYRIVSDFFTRAL